MNRLDGITPEAWARLLSRVFSRISDDARCKPIIQAIGPVRFQLRLRDRPDLSYWEEYLGDRVIPHLGIADECTVLAETTFPVLTGTLLRTLSLMEAAADEAYDIKGDTEALMRCANLLPYVMMAFSQLLESELGAAERRAVDE